MGDSIMKQKIYFEENENGKYKVIDKGRIKIKLLKEPSEKYFEEKQKKIELRQQKLEEKKEKNKIKAQLKEKEKLIKEKMRELAIQELKKEGKL